MLRIEIVEQKLRNKLFTKKKETEDLEEVIEEKDLNSPDGLDELRKLSHGKHI